MDFRNRPGGEYITWKNIQTKLLSPNTAIRIATWNVRTIYETGKAAQVAREMERYKVEILGRSEVRWNIAGRTTLASGETVLHSGPPEENVVHRHGVGFMLTKKASKSLVEWEPVGKRIITARFESKFQKVTNSSMLCPY